MLAEQVDYVVGVDTHRDEHALAVVDARTGAVIAQTTTATNARGYANAVRFADRYAPDGRLWAIEGTGHYGAGLTRQLQRQGEKVHEVGRQPRGERRLRGKDDALDAIRAARSAVEVRRVALVQLRSLLVTAPEQLREELRRLPLGQLLRRCSRFRRSDSRPADQHAIVLTLRSLARRIEAQPRRPTSSSGRSSSTSERSHRTCSTSPGWDQSSQHS